MQNEETKSKFNTINYASLPAELTLEQFKTWIIYEDEDVIAVNKPADVVCHPSKDGPMSSLVGIARVYCLQDILHPVTRLDRETSGIVVIAKHKKIARILQMAVEKRQTNKFYLSILKGEMKNGTLSICQPLLKDKNSLVHIKQAPNLLSPTTKYSLTSFEPISVSNGYTLALTHLITGRKHQIRAHAKWANFPVIGDKIYGEDETYYLDFIEKTNLQRLEENLEMPRQALHAYSLEFTTSFYKKTFIATLAPDMLDFCNEKGLKVPEKYLI